MGINVDYVVGKRATEEQLELLRSNYVNRVAIADEIINFTAKLKEKYDDKTRNQTSIRRINDVSS